LKEPLDKEGIHNPRNKMTTLGRFWTAQGRSPQHKEGDHNTKNQTTVQGRQPQHKERDYSIMNEDKPQRFTGK